MANPLTFYLKSYPLNVHKNPYFYLNEQMGGKLAHCGGLRENKGEIYVCRAFAAHPNTLADALKKQQICFPVNLLTGPWIKLLL